MAVKHKKHAQCRGEEHGNKVGETHKREGIGMNVKGDKHKPRHITEVEV